MKTTTAQDTPLPADSADTPTERPARDINSAPVSAIAPSPTNPRKNFPEVEQAELVDSVKRHGILQPILVRPWPSHYKRPRANIRYEIVAGERRWRAAKAAGLLTIPILLRDLDDGEVLEMQIIENLHRRDLHPLEEADGYRRMMTNHRYTADTLAAKIGKSKAYIYGRLKLADLGEDARQAFIAGMLSASVALLVARIPTHKLQAMAVARIADEAYDATPMSVREVKRMIRFDFMLDLDRAPFPLDIAFKGVDACTDCPKRTGNQPELFDDVDCADVCTDPDCFVDKRERWKIQQATAAAAAGREVITGADARKIAPHGVSNHVSSDEDFISLDAHYWEDPERRTIREILGDTIPVTLIEDVNKGVLIEAAPGALVASRLIAAGVMPRDSADDYWAIQKQKQAKVDAESAYRLRLLDQINNACLLEIGAHLLTASADSGGRLVAIGELIVDRLLARSGSDTQSRIAKLWTRTTSADQLPSPLTDGATFRAAVLEIAGKLIDLALIGETAINIYTINNKPHALLDAARILDFNPDTIRRQITAEAKASAKA